MPQNPTDRSEAAESNSSPPLPVWQHAWFQTLLAALLILAVASLVIPTAAWLIYTIRSVLLPVLVAFAMAYAADPLVDWLERKRVPRQASAAGLILAFLLVVAGLATYVLPLLVEQIIRLVTAMPHYASSFLKWTHIDIGSLTAQAIGSKAAAAHAASKVDWSAIGSAALKSLDIGYQVISSTIGLASYAVLAIAVLFFCFYFFVWKFDAITHWFIPFIPESHREKTLTVIHKMDHSVSGFIHGRMVQATCVAVVLSVGWGFAHVPYFLLLGILGGVLNLIPYAAVASWPLAILLTWLDTLTGGAASHAATQAAQAAPAFSVMHVFVWPTIVYVIAQGLDGWVVEPLVQGKATDLDPLTVMLVVLLGGSLAGLLGMLIAIPTAACIKIFARDVALPRLRAIAAKN